MAQGLSLNDGTLGSARDTAAHGQRRRSQRANKLEKIKDLPTFGVVVVPHCLYFGDASYYGIVDLCTVLVQSSKT